MTRCACVWKLIIKKKESWRTERKELFSFVFQGVLTLSSSLAKVEGVVVNKARRERLQVRRTSGRWEGGCSQVRGRGLSAAERGAWACAGEGDGNKQLKAL